MTGAQPRTRVAIPLHRSRPWFDTVAGNIRRLAGVAAATVSDATEVDDTLSRLESSLRGVPHLTFVGARDVGRGWVSHCNDLLDRSREEFFMWLPHDDEIGPDWVVEAERLLDDAQDAVLAHGTIVPIRERGVSSGGRRIEPHEAFDDPDTVARVRHALELCVGGDSSLLGATFRGLQRRSHAVPLPETLDDGDWADVLWATRLLTRGRFVTMSAIYAKRWHPTSAHATWVDGRLREEFRSRWLPDTLVDLDPLERESLLRHAWNVKSARLMRRSDEIRGLFEGSLSWRITAPLRWLGTTVRRLRG